MKELSFGNECPKYFPLPTLTDKAGKNCKRYCSDCKGIDENRKIVICDYKTEE